MRLIFPSKMFNSSAETKQLHKNLLIENFETHSFSLSHLNCPYEDEIKVENDCASEENEFNTNSYRLGHFPLLLTG